MTNTLSHTQSVSSNEGIAYPVLSSTPLAAVHAVEGMCGGVNRLDLREVALLGHVDFLE